MLPFSNEMYGEEAVFLQRVNKKEPLASELLGKFFFFFKAAKSLSYIPKQLNKNLRLCNLSF